jgi:hypothetical protein
MLSQEQLQEQLIFAGATVTEIQYVEIATHIQARLTYEHMADVRLEMVRKYLELRGFGCWIRSA